MTTRTSLFLLIFIPATGIASLVLGIMYVNDQQTLRLGANEPQEWLARDVAARISGGEDATTILGDQKVAIESMEGTYVDVYDASATPTAGTGYLHGSLPTVSRGVFDTATRDGINRITWQPEAGVRDAIVVVPIASQLGGFVLAGRSLRYVEQQEDLLTKRTALGWAIVVATIAFAALVIAFVLKRTRRVN